MDVGVYDSLNIFPYFNLSCGKTLLWYYSVQPALEKILTVASPCYAGGIECRCGCPGGGEDGEAATGTPPTKGSNSPTLDPSQTASRLPHCPE